ncbi:hypothetical protein ACFQ2B_02820 [Streptomyces stramineus]
MRWRSTPLGAERGGARVPGRRGGAHGRRAGGRTPPDAPLRRLLSALAVLLVLALTGGTVAVQQSRQVMAGRHAARAEALAVRSTLVGPARPEVAMLLATAAWRHARTPAAASAVLNTQTQLYAGRLARHRGIAKAVAWSPRGDRVLSAGVDGDVQEWDVRTRRRTGVAANRTAVNTLAVARRRELAAWGTTRARCPCARASPAGLLPCRRAAGTGVPFGPWPCRTGARCWCRRATTGRSG